jgi:hypothetical protein
MSALAVVCLPIRALFFIILFVVLYPIFLLMGFLAAITTRLQGPPSKALATGSSTPEVGPRGGGKAAATPGGYWCQFMMARPFDDKEKVERVFKDLMKDCGLEGDSKKKGAIIEWVEEEPKVKEFQYGALSVEHYFESGNWGKIGLGKGDHCRLRINNRPKGEPTMMQCFLPGNSFDGTSNFNIAKEFLSRYYDYEKKDIFMSGRTTLKQVSAQNIDSASSFCSFLCRMPINIFINTVSLCSFLTTISGCCGGVGGQPEIALINFDLNTSAKLKATCDEKGVKPYALLLWAVVNAYKQYTGRWPKIVAKQVSLQRQHYDPPNPNRDWTGDWLFGPLEKVKPGYTLEDAMEGYTKMIADIGNGDEGTGPSGAVLRAFEAKAYGVMKSGAGSFEIPIPTYNLPIRGLSSCIWMNNYGIRSTVPEAEVIYYNWAMPNDLGCNTMQINGRTCLALASLKWGREGVDEMRNNAYKLIMETIGMGDQSAIIKAQGMRLA